MASTNGRRGNYQLTIERLNHLAVMLGLDLSIACRRTDARLVK
jgi:hypothetical protein